MTRTKEMAKREYTFKIPVTWQMAGTMLIVAETLDEAIDTAYEQEQPLPESSYIENSFDIDYELAEDANAEWVLTNKGETYGTS